MICDFHSSITQYWYAYRKKITCRNRIQPYSTFRRIQNPFENVLHSLFRQQFQMRFRIERICFERNYCPTEFRIRVIAGVKSITSSILFWIFCDCSYFLNILYHITSTSTYRVLSMYCLQNVFFEISVKQVIRHFKICESGWSWSRLFYYKSSQYQYFKHCSTKCNIDYQCYLSFRMKLLHLWFNCSGNFVLSSYLAYI